MATSLTRFRCVDDIGRAVRDASEAETGGGCAHPEIVVPRSGRAPREPASLLEHLAPEHRHDEHRVARSIMSTNPISRPSSGHGSTGLPSSTPLAKTQRVFGPTTANSGRRSSRPTSVVANEGSHRSSPSRNLSIGRDVLHGDVARVRHPRFGPRNAHARIAGGVPGATDGRTTVGRAVVDNDEFQIVQSLSETDSIHPPCVLQGCRPV